MSSCLAIGGSKVFNHSQFLQTWAAEIMPSDYIGPAATALDWNEWASAPPILKQAFPHRESTDTGWWFQPISKILVKMGIFPK